jgi:hypothetical protein
MKQFHYLPQESASMAHPHVLDFFHKKAVADQIECLTTDAVSREANSL